MYVQLGHWTASISVWWRGFADSSPLRHVRLMVAHFVGEKITNEVKYEMNQ
jgi:hypothetical protein